MRGTFFKQPLEFKLDVKGDEWRQGDSISCALSVKNRGTSTESLAGLFMNLACGDIKGVREKSAEAFSVISAAEMAAPAALEAGQDYAAPWQFDLDRNCTITDKGQSLYLLCGKGSPAEIAGQLAVNVLPHPHLEAVTSLLESSFSFVLKSQKSKKDWVETKLKAPGGKDFPTLEHLLLSMRFEGEVLQLKYCFQVKALQASATTLEVKKAKRELLQELPMNSYLLGGHVDNDKIEEKLSEALEPFRTKM